MARGLRAGGWMRRFAALYGELDRCSGNSERIEALLRYFAAVEPAEAAWALQVLLGRQRRRLISGRRLREICMEALELPAWLLDDCHAQVGDSAETIALLWPQRAAAARGADAAAGWPASEPAQLPEEASGAAWREEPLQQWMQELLPQAAALRGAEQAEAVRRLWQGLEAEELLVVNKLLGGGLRVGVGEGLVLKALARHSGREEALLRHRLMGGFQPNAEAYRQLLAEAEDPAAVPSRPYPFCLASPLPLPEAGAQPLPGEPRDWLLEWKWDGIRAQLIRRAGQTFLWSRGEELIQAAFPEVIEAAAALPEGTVLDGELLVWPQGAERPAAFGQLQRRLGRSKPGRAILRECPVRLLAYDLLERDGIDLRAEPLSRRRSALEALLHTITPAAIRPGAGVLGLSPRLACGGWQELEALRQGALALGAEGLMLKALDSPYRAGRRRGSWWKHKRDPWRLDAVLLYAQAGSGRRANLFTDYTFALWDRPLGEPAGPAGAEAAQPADPAAAAGGRQGEAEPTAAAEARAPGRAEPASAEPIRPEAQRMRRLVSFAKAYSGLEDQEILQLDRWIRSHTIERFGPVRAVQPLLVFELAFEGLQRSGRHQSGIAVRFPRISRWRHDKPAAEADCLADALALLAAAEGGP